MTEAPQRRPERRHPRRAACVALAALLVCAAPALAQQQIDPSVPVNIPPEDLHDFKGFLDQVMDDIMAANGPTVLNAGNTLWRGLAAIVVVWTGIKIAMSGTFSMWALIELVIGLWIPWVMLLFYATPIPGGRPGRAYSTKSPTACTTTTAGTARTHQSTAVRSAGSGWGRGRLDLITHLPLVSG